MLKVLIVDDDASIREVMSYHLRAEGYEVETAADGAEGLELFTGFSPDVVLSDIVMPGMDGIGLLREIRATGFSGAFIMITAHGSVGSAVEAMKLGAYDYVEKPFTADALKAVVKRAARLVSLEKENTMLRQAAAEKFSFGKLIGTSAKMVEVFRLASRVAQGDTTVFIHGESGTGKELLARAIHFNSPRKDGPFVAINVGAIPESLVDSELFGHEKGAFTGAVGKHVGAFERANGGTIFLDEISDMRPDHQVRLLRVLQEREVQRVGGGKPAPVDVRVIAASNRNVEEMVADGEFREDLYYRLCVVPVTLPPLRERREDIPLLAAHFLEKHRKESGAAVLRFADSAYDVLARHNWPGNVRELENLIHRCVATAASGEIGAEDLPENVRAGKPGPGGPVIELPDEGVVLEDLEKEIIRRALEKNGFNQSRTARYLGITRNTLLYRLEKYGLKTQQE